MTDIAPDTTPGIAPDDQTARIAFIDHHRPAMPAGRYTVEVTHAVTLPKVTDSFTARRTFTVAAEPYTLQPADVFGVFPPEGSLGDHSHVLPHIVLTRSTHPWELSADGGTTPWLALLLFGEGEDLGGTITRPAVDEVAAGLWTHLLSTGVRWLTAIARTDDVALVTPREDRAAAVLADPFTALTGTADALLERHRTPQVVTLGSLVAPMTGPVAWPGLRVDEGLHELSEKVTVIDVDTAKLHEQLPSKEHLNLLTHVRRPESAAGGRTGEEWAVVVGRRLPARNRISEAHLVSVDNRYPKGVFPVASSPYTRLISLKSWRFACADRLGDFAGLLTGLNITPSTLRLPVPPLKRDATAAEAAAHLTAGTHLSSGRVPVPHRQRAGGDTVSWYRGPLLPHPPAGEPTLPAGTAADLRRFDASVGMFDVSWAAAWEIGRLLALRNKPLARSLYAWKRAHRRATQAAGDWLLGHGDDTGDAGGDAASLPADVVAFFGDLRVLRGVPPHYLVPDERMLPPESIRFVQLDPAWVDCLVDGAFSIGRLTGRVGGTDQTQDSVLHEHLTPHPTVTGFLLRSSVVAGWPGLLADGFPGADGEDALPCLRSERLGLETLLCLYTGEVGRVEIHQAPETLHFGTEQLIGGTWRNDEDVADLDLLAAALKLPTNFGAADLAVRLVEGVPRVTFERS